MTDDRTEQAISRATGNGDLPDLDPSSFWLAAEAEKALEPFPLPELGGTVYLRPVALSDPDAVAFVDGPGQQDLRRFVATLRGRDYTEDRIVRETLRWRDAFTITPEESTTRQYVSAVILGVCTADGTRMFSFDQPDKGDDDHTRLRRKLNRDTLARLATRIYQLSMAEVSIDEGKEPSDDGPDSETSTD